MVIGKANLGTFKGPTVIASTLHSVAILLKQARSWDRFINLSASDYPLIPQDGFQRVRPIIISWPIRSKRSGVFWTTEKRSVPASFKLFLGLSLELFLTWLFFHQFN